MKPPAGRPARLLVMLSGSGRTLDNLIACIDRNELDARVAAVVAGKPCRGLEIARRHGIPTVTIERRLHPHELDDLVEQHRADWVVLAGYLRLVPVTDRTRGRIINIHPALLPNFGGPGMHGMAVHKAVVDAAKRGEVTESGCTVHYADEQYDTGDTILQMRCPVHPTDTPQQLADRVFELELQAYPEALRRLIANKPDSEQNR